MKKLAIAICMAMTLAACSAEEPPNPNSYLTVTPSTEYELVDGLTKLSVDLENLCGQEVIVTTYHCAVNDYMHTPNFHTPMRPGEKKTIQLDIVNDEIGGEVKDVDLGFQVYDSKTYEIIGNVFIPTTTINQHAKVQRVGGEILYDGKSIRIRQMEDGRLLVENRTKDELLVSMDGEPWPWCQAITDNNSYIISEGLITPPMHVKVFLGYTNEVVEEFDLK